MNMDLVVLAKAVAVEHGLDPLLVCAVIERESTWNPDDERFEPGFLAHYVLPLKLTSQTEIYSRAFSRGLMQLMGQCARERGFTGQLSTLFHPDVNLEWGCRHLKYKLDHAGEDVHRALQDWNGGKNPYYADEVIQMREHYR